MNSAVPVGATCGHGMGHGRAWRPAAPKLKGRRVGGVGWVVGRHRPYGMTATARPAVAALPF
jgi:hypothetical protein